MQKCLKTWSYIHATNGIRKHDSSVRAVEDRVATAIGYMVELFVPTNALRQFFSLFSLL
jgi:hypothetical protein